MTFMPLELDLNKYGILSGQLYHPEVHSVGQLEQSANFRKDARLVILLHGWGADGSDLAPLAPSLLSQASVASEDTSSANHSSFGGAVFVPDAPNICSANPFGRQWFELSDPASGIGRNASACLQTAEFIAAMLDALSMRIGYASDQIILGGFSQGGMVSLTAGVGYEKPLAGLFCLSGAWLTSEQTCHQPKGLPVFLAHGVLDPVVPFACITQAEADLKKVGLTPQTLHREHMAHGIDPETIDALARFIASL